MLPAQLQAVGAFSAQTPPARLSESERALVKDVLSRYDPNQLSREDSRAIASAFEERGLRPSPGLKEAVEAEGFDARALARSARELAEERRAARAEQAAAANTQAQGRPPPGSDPATIKGGGFDEGRFQMLRQAVDGFRASDQGDSERRALAQTLERAGLNRRGAVLNAVI